MSFSDNNFKDIMIDDMIIIEEIPHGVLGVKLESIPSWIEKYESLEDRKKSILKKWEKEGRITL